MKWLARSYYVALRSVLRWKPWLRECLAHCRHCGIFFLCDRRNAGRKDLGCPFGCSHAHRRQESTRRSIAYYQDPEGKEKKRALNARRRRKAKSTPTETTTTPSSAAVTPSAPARTQRPNPMVAYLCALIGLVEGRPIQPSELEAILERAGRQHSMVRTRRLDQALAWFNERPP